MIREQLIWEKYDENLDINGIQVNTISTNKFIN